MAFSFYAVFSCYILQLIVTTALLAKPTFISTCSRNDVHFGSRRIYADINQPKCMHPSLLQLRKLKRKEHFLGQDQKALFSATTDTTEDENGGIDFVNAEDGDALQALFSKECDENGLMTKGMLQDVRGIASLLEDGELLQEEFEKIWDAAQKFPGIGSEKIDVDSFIQIYRDIDDLFEDDNDEDGSSSLSVPRSEASDSVEDGDTIETDNDEDKTLARDEQELESVFKSICDEAGLVSKQALRGWDEVQQLLDEKMLGEDEFDEMWKKTGKSPGSEQLDVDGFLSFNVALDYLFDFEDDDDAPEPVGNKSILSTPSSAIKEELSENNENSDIIFSQLSDENDMVGMEDLKECKEIKEMIADGNLLLSELDSFFAEAPKAPGNEDKLDKSGFLVLYRAIDDMFDDMDENISSLPSSVIVEKDSENFKNANLIFLQIADENAVVGMEDLKKCREIKEMIDDGDILLSELETFFAEAPKAPGNEDKLDKSGFLALYGAIEDLFEEDGYDGNDISMSTTKDSSGEVKNNLLNLLVSLVDDERELCGLDCDDREQAQVLELVTVLEADPSNKVLSMGKDIKQLDLDGTWDLLYTSSGMMQFSKGLTGLGGSIPNGKFGGLQQKLSSSSYYSDVEYIERINVIPEESSFDATVTGSWELKNSASLFTGSSTILMSIEPLNVIYGPTNTRADHWKSVRCMNLLDISYLDDDFRIMRGNTSTDTIFILKKRNSNE